MKSFDKSCPSWLIMVAFEILKQNIDFTKYAEEGIPTPYKLERAWDHIVWYFIRTPIRLCNGERYRKWGGVASGSYFTQMVDSIINFIIMRFALHSQSVKIFEDMYLGDDSLIATSSEVDIEQLCQDLSSIGFTVNRKKTSQTTRTWEIEFLGYRLSNGWPERDSKLLWTSLLYPESPDLNASHFVARVQGLLISNYMFDEEFDRTCRAIVRAAESMGVRPEMSRSTDRWCSLMGISNISAISQLDCLIMVYS